MYLNLIILIGIGLIAYFHYTEGFFSATLSAIFAVIAAILAVGYHEMVAVRVFGEHAPSYSLAFSLVGIFAVAYIVPRFLFDAVVPGNIRLPLMVDRIGAATMGIIAALFATGVIALAAQTLPFSSGAAGFSRFETVPRRKVSTPPENPGHPMDDGLTYDELKNDTLDPSKAGGLWIPVDDIVVGMTSYMSTGGALSADQSFRAIHPDYQTELFGDRVGMIPNSKHTALPGAFTVGGVYKIEKIPQLDGEFSSVRQDVHPITPVLTPTAGMLLVVRLRFTADTADEAGFLRLSTGAVRLVAGGKNYFPLGTLEGANMLISNKPDDYLFTEPGKGVDFLFDVDPAALLGKSAGAPDAKPAAGTFIEFKHLARADLSNQEIQTTIPPSPDVAVLRQKDLISSQEQAAAKAKGKAPK